MSERDPYKLTCDRCGEKVGACDACFDQFKKSFMCDLNTHVCVNCNEENIEVSLDDCREVKE